MSTPVRVVVVGGGYAGVTAANRLTQRTDVSVTLINPRPVFVERIRLHQLVGGSDDAVAAFADVLAGPVQLLVDSVTRIDPGARRVGLGSGGGLEYDHLIYAVGSGSASPVVPGVSEFALPLGDLEEAERVRGRLGVGPAEAPVVVVGAGPTGIEVAAELAEGGRDVTLVGELGPYLHPRARLVVARQLERLGVTVLAGARVTAVHADSVDLDGDRSLPSAVTIWTAGFGVPGLAARSGLGTDAAGRLLTDETLTSVTDERIVGAGDSAAPSGRPFRMSCQAAGQLGSHAADTVLARIGGRSPAPVAVAFVGQCLSLGRHRGLVQFSHRDDTATRAFLGGRAAARLKETVCRGTVWQLGLEARRPGRLTVPAWVTGPGRGSLEPVRSSRSAEGVS